ncbi:NlpC/P60 family protein [Ezakiella coagulans]|uniref:NlpC/P60 family protein n=1 Tax=Ezakiella coagulans TaxID=46507 RepID=A0A2U1E2F8_9FIRM|nr:C40 family peptidase [Ezakiella coagulans]PVY94012.1 NlpC/P60 family protein [Ezakiella coagulans]UQK60956.1 C40 family peptidase [Ezakiella coagulans]
MHKVIKNVLRVTGAVAVLALATFDTGTIINPVQVTTPSGKQTSFTDGENVEIKETKSEGYVVVKNNENVLVTKNNILLKEVVSSNIVVKRITALKKDKNTDDAIRFLLEDEELSVIKNEGQFSLVKTEDDLTGYVLSEDISVSVMPKINLGFIKNAFVYGGRQYNKDDAVIVRDYENGNFICLDNAGNILAIQKDNIRFQDEFLNRSDDELNRVNIAESNNLVSIAKSQLGKPYVFGSSGPSSFDCSGFTTFVFRQMGIKLPRTSVSQSRFGKPVDKANLQVGDLLFFNTSGAGVSHVGIYIGNGQFIHSASGINPGVVIDKLNSNYYIRTYVNARRVL